MGDTPKLFKIPLSVLVVIHTLDGHVLLIRRTDSGTWQSVTGSKDHPDESWADTAVREVFEETGIQVHSPGCHLHDWQLENQYDIYPEWRWRYHPDVSRNTERVFGLLVPPDHPIVLSPQEHTESQWLPLHAAADQCFSASNAEAILMLPRFLQQVAP